MSYQGNDLQPSQPLTSRHELPNAVVYVLHDEDNDEFTVLLYHNNLSACLLYSAQVCDPIDCEHVKRARSLERAHQMQVAQKYSSREIRQNTAISCLAALKADSSAKAPLNGNGGFSLMR